MIQTVSHLVREHHASMKLTVPDLCQMLQVNQATVHRWIQEEELPTQMVNGQPFFHRSDVLEWATLRNRRFSPEIFRASDEFTATALSEALRLGGIYYDVPGIDAPSLLANVVARLPLPEGFDRVGLAELFVAREAVASTGIGGGIAIPHPRHPVIVPGQPPSVTLCFTEQPVQFGALDGQPVTALFATITPNPRIHLHLLARLALASRDLGILQCLRLQQSQELIFAELDRYEAALSTGSVSAPAVSAYTPL
ncbi:MAG: DNA-binding protein excisionase family [Planctomycetaceae bacterium]|nr:DNA-binding protein excisionase family [Planctomycetaceae bacterium]